MAQHGTLLKQAKEKQSAVFADLGSLSKKHGPEVFRILGQRFFKHERELAAVKREIAQREDELQRLHKKAGR